MSKQYVKNIVLWLFDVACVSVAFLLAINTRFDAPLDDMVTDNMAVYAALLVMTFAMNFAVRDNRGFMRRSGLRELGHVMRYGVVLVLGVAVASYAFKISPAPSRMLLVEIFLYSVVVMAIGRWLAKRMARLVFKDTRAGSAIVMIVERGQRERVERAFNPGLTYAIAGWLELEQKRVEGTVQGQAISCDVVELPDAMHAAGIERVGDFYVCAPDGREHDIAEVVDAVERLGSRCHVAIDLPYPGIEGAQLDYFGELPVLTYASGGSDVYRRYVKRVFDIVISALVLLLLCWLYLIVALVIKIDDPKGPVFFKQRRIGKDGRPFVMWKFRSMYADAEERFAELQKYNEKDGPVFKMKNDPRITRVGHFIRRTSLDEMPQFFNVLKGDMSIVGPRPALPREVVQYNPHQRERLLVRPGLTCYWQIQPNRDDVSFEEWIDLDLLYIRQCSLTVDTKLIARTVGVVLTGQGS